MKVDLDTLRAFFASAPFMADLGIEPTGGGDGRIDSALLLQPRHYQHTGQVHAGVMVTMADHSMGAAAQTLAPEGFVVITAELSTRLLRAARGERLLCEARVVKPGRQISFTEADVFVEADGRRVHVVRASATMALVARDRLG
ncbi:MAG TPA: PaaI family thioesterase [Rubrivivax sp.]|nr:PaaI family thioesterase [Rubrivivax sp.]